MNGEIVLPAKRETLRRVSVEESNKKRLAFLSAILLAMIVLSLPNIAVQASVSTETDQHVEQMQPQLVVQLGHSGAIRAVVFSSDGRFLISGSEDGTAIVWETETGRQIRRFEGH